MPVDITPTYNISPSSLYIPNKDGSSKINIKGKLMIKHVKNWQVASENGASTISKNSSIKIQCNAKNKAPITTNISAVCASNLLSVVK